MTGATSVALGASVILNSVDAFGTKWRLLDWDDGGSTDPDIDPVKKPRGSGTWAGDSFDSERIMVAQGTITALTPDILNTAIDVLKAAVTNTPFLLQITESGRVRWCYARKQMSVRSKKVTSLHATYYVQIVNPDGRLFSAALTGSTHEFATSGGRTVPFTVPFTIASSVASGLITLVNPGSIVGPVIARIDGPSHGPIVTHTGPSGAVQVFSLTGLNLVAGEWLVIDMEKKTVYANGTASRSAYVTSRVWSGFEPGLNLWSFSAVSFDAAALLTITATPAN